MATLVKNMLDCDCFVVGKGSVRMNVRTGLVFNEIGRTCEPGQFRSAQNKGFLTLTD
jgi:hypothetical protein